MFLMKNSNVLDYYRVIGGIVSVSKKIIKNICNYSLLTSIQIFNHGNNLYQIDHYHIDEFKVFIGYIYFGKLYFVPDQSELLRGLCGIAKDYSVEGLLNEISDYLQNKINFNNCIDILEIASDFKIENLIKAVIEFIGNNLNQWISQTESNINLTKINGVVAHQLLNHSDY